MRFDINCFVCRKTFQSRTSTVKTCSLECAQKRRNQIRRERLKVRFEVSFKNKVYLYEKQNKLCSGCGFRLPFHVFTVDHINPVRQGGSVDFGNLQLLCNYCNSVKGEGDMERLRKKVKRKRCQLGYHPKQKYE